MPTEFRSDRPPLTLSNWCLNLFGQWRPCFLRYANVLIIDCAPMDQDVAYQFSSRSDQRSRSYSCFFVTAPPSGKAAQFFFISPKIVLTNMCLEFGEDISFRSRVIAFFVKLALDFRTFWGPIAKLSRNFNFFLIIIDIHFPENISAVVSFRSGEKPRTSSQK